MITLLKLDVFTGSKTNVVPFLNKSFWWADPFLRSLDDDKMIKYDHKMSPSLPIYVWLMLLINYF